MEENIFSFKVCVKARGVEYEKIVLSLTAEFKIKKIFVTKQKLMKSSYLIACDTAQCDKDNFVDFNILIFRIGGRELL